MDEEIDEFDECASSSSERARCNTSFVWEEFIVLPKVVDGQQKAKCKKCDCAYVVGDHGTSNLLLSHEQIPQG